MTDLPPDESRLRATEAQMRRALGLNETGGARTGATPQTPMRGTDRGSGRFGRSADVEVAVVRRDRHPTDPTTPGGNPLDAARQAIRAQAAERERAERLLEEARAAVRDLQTKLAHERMAKEEQARAFTAQKATADAALAAVQAELAAERERCAELKAELANALAMQQQVEQPPPPPEAPPKVKAAPRPVGRPRKILMDELPLLEPEPPARRKPRRPEPKEAPVDAETGDFVEWWKPGWREQFR